MKLAAMEELGIQVRTIDVDGGQEESTCALCQAYEFCREHSANHDSCPLNGCGSYRLFTPAFKKKQYAEAAEIANEISRLSMDRMVKYLDEYHGMHCPNVPIDDCYNCKPEIERWCP